MNIYMTELNAPFIRYITLINKVIIRTVRTIGIPSYCQKDTGVFQAFTNTYAPVERLRQVFTEAINAPDVEILSIATRPAL